MPTPTMHMPAKIRQAACLDYIIYPYELNGCLVFDDPVFELVAEELVRGTDDLVRFLAHGKKNIAVLISSTPRPASDHLHFLRREPDGYHTYGTRFPEVPEISLCPNFLRYYPQPPEYLWINVKDAET